jgi:hypothetical protein
MSTATLPPTTSDSGDWDDFLQFAAIVEDFDRDELPEPDRSLRHHTHRPARSAADQAAIDESLREGR